MNEQRFLYRLAVDLGLTIAEVLDKFSDEQLELLYALSAMEGSG